MSDDETFLEQFEAATWPLEEWHHKQHIKVAYLYLRRFPFETAMSRMREGVKTYNAAKKLPDSLLSGYHETMTQAWMRLVHFTLCEYGPAESADVFYEQHPQLSQKKTLRFFYSKELFTSPQAKAEFQNPDLAAFPQSKKNGNDDEFLEAFESHSWPLDQWHHRQHIKVAYLYLRSYPLDAAIAKICSGIKSFNAAHQVPEGLHRGYHETMTQAWMHLVHCTLREFGASENADAFVDKHAQLLSKRALLFFYSRDRIMSAEAKSKFVEPDLTPLPQSKNNFQTSK